MLLAHADASRARFISIRQSYTCSQLYPEWCGTEAFSPVRAGSEIDSPVDRKIRRLIPSVRRSRLGWGRFQHRSGPLRIGEQRESNRNRIMNGSESNRIGCSRFHLFRNGPRSAGATLPAARRAVPCFAHLWYDHGASCWGAPSMVPIQAGGGSAPREGEAGAGRGPEPRACLERRIRQELAGRSSVDGSGPMSTERTIAGWLP